MQDNGGQTRTMAPLAGSPAIDAGTSGGLPTDQIGQLRTVTVSGIVNGGDGTDIGAFELQCSLDVPALNIARAGNGVILDSPWPSRFFILQKSTDLNNWMDANYPINVVGNQNQIVVDPAPDNLSFRLKK